MTTTYLAYIPSPSQGVWHIGPVPLRAYAMFIIIGIIAALVIGDRRWVARGGQAGVIYDVALVAVPFGLIGGRLYHVMTDWRTYFGEDGAGLAGALRIWDGGLGIWGAVALGGVGAWIACRNKGIPLPAFGDAIAPGIILAQAIGRLGNYFNQELFGRPTTLPWGLEIYERVDANGAPDTLNGVSTGQLLEIVHPTFLYELLWNLLVFAALIWIDRRFKIGHGRLFAMYVAGYCVGRFWVELMRSDVATHIAGIRVNSFTSTFVFIGAVVYIMIAPKGREDPASLAGKPEATEVEDAVETFAKELTAVAATTGVVAAAKAAGDVEDEDAKVDAVDEPEATEQGEEPEVQDAETLGADVAGVPADTVEEAEEFAAEGEDEEPEAGVGAVEGEEVAEAVEAAPEVHDAEVEAAEEAESVADEVATEGQAGAVEQPDESGEAETVAEEPETTDEAEAVADEVAAEVGLGAVEAEEVADAVEVAPEVHDAEVEAAVEAEAVADEVAAEGEAAESEQSCESGEAEAVAEEPESGEAEQSDAGLGAVEGEEVAEAVEVAPEVHDAEVDAAAEAEVVADKAAAEDDEPLSEAAAEAEELTTEVAEAPDEDIEAAAEFAATGADADAVETDDSERDEPETEAAEAAVEEASTEPSEEEAEAVVDEADAAAEDEPTTGVLEEAKPQSAAKEPERVVASGGRLSRWLRRNR